MNKKLFLSVSAILVLVLLLLPSCNWFKGKQETAQKSSGEAALPIIIDVNDEEIYNDAHIKGAINFAYDKVVSDAEFLTKETANWNKKGLIVVYCTNYQCTASSDVAKRLKSLGFENVSVYKGGIQQWVQRAGGDIAYEYEGPADLDYLRKPLQIVEYTDSVIPQISAEELANRFR